MYFIVENHCDGGQCCIGYRKVFTDYNEAIKEYNYRMETKYCFCYDAVKFGVMENRPEEGVFNAYTESIL